MELLNFAGGVIRLAVGLAFLGYGIFCIVMGLKHETGCLFAFFNLFLAPLATGIMLFLFPSIQEELTHMDETGEFVIMLAVFFFMAPVTLNMFTEADRLPGIINGMGFVFLGMIISGVVSEAIIMGGALVLARMIACLFLPILILSALIAMWLI